MEEQAAVWAIVELMGHVRLAGRITEEDNQLGDLRGRVRSQRETVQHRVDTQHRGAVQGRWRGVLCKAIRVVANR